MQKIKEDFLYYLWKTKNFDLAKIKTIEGDSIEVEQFGYQNLASGPDFSDAKIRIGNTLWAGNVEMHIFSSDWKKHNHQKDPAYNNVILHVVFEHDREVVFQHSNPEFGIPTLELKHYIPKNIIQTYRSFLESKTWIPCQELLTDEAKEVFSLWKYSLAVQRLWVKTAYIGDLLANLNEDWEELTYVIAARYFGATVNSIAFEQLALASPLSILKKNQYNRLAVTAILFGQAGMLSANFDDAYFQSLKREYQFQQKKYKLTPMQSSVWKFGGMMPHGLPSFRIAQFAALISTGRMAFGKILELNNIKEVYNLLSLEADEYWEDHFTFKTDAKHHKTELSKAFIERLIINVIVPITFLFGKKTDNQAYVDKSINLLEAIKPEANAIVKKWKELGIPSEHAFDTQSLIHLKKDFCDKKKCMQCNIGHRILKSSL